MILHRSRRLIAAALLALAPSLVFAQAALQQPVTSSPPDTVPVAVSKLYQNDLFLQGLITSRFGTLGAAALLNVGTVTGTVADGGALAAEIVRAKAAEQTNATNIATNATAISTETSRAQAAEALKAPLASPNLTGSPTTPTPPAGDTSTRIANMAAVAAAVSAGGGGGGAVSSVAGRTGAVTLTASDLTDGTALGRSVFTAANAAAARSSLGAAESGANSSITSLTGLTTALPITAGGTGATSAGAARSALGAAASGANTDITSLGSGVTGVTPAANDNSTKIPTTAFVQGALPVLGQAQLSYSSASALLVKPYAGNLVTINGVPQVVPSAGVTCSSGGIAAGTLTYEYLWMNGATMACEVSTTAHVTAANGAEIKSGDATRTLVGMAYVATAATFVDSATQRFVASWFKGARQDRVLLGASTVSGTTSTSTTEINTGLRVAFITWADEAPDLGANGFVYNDNAGQSTQAILTIDGTVSVQGSNFHSSSSGFAGNSALKLRQSAAEGMHYATIVGSCNGGTGRFALQINGAVRS